MLVTWGIDGNCHLLVDSCTALQCCLLAHSISEIADILLFCIKIIKYKVHVHLLLHAELSNSLHYLFKLL